MQNFTALRAQCSHFDGNTFGREIPKDVKGLASWTPFHIQHLFPSAYNFHCKKTFWEMGCFPGYGEADSPTESDLAYLKVLCIAQNI